MKENLVSEFLQMGCKSQKNAALAAQIYLELCEVKKYWDVEYFYNSSLERLYFTAKISKNEQPSIFVPIAVSESISFNSLQDLTKIHLETPTDLSSSIYAVFVEADSTSVYYQICNNIGSVPSLSSKVAHEEKSQKLDVELKKYRELLEYSALCGLPVTIPKNQEMQNTIGVKTEETS